MKRINSITLITLFCFTSVTSLYSQSPSFSWVNGFGSSLAEDGKSIINDTAGNIYAVGEFRGTVDFDPSPATLTLTSAGSSDLYITKTDAFGNLIWAKRIGGSNSETGNSIAIDVNGDLLITGGYNGTVDFDPNFGVFNLTSNGSMDVYVLKVNINGGLVWAKSMGGTSADEGTSVGTSAFGVVYTLGTFNGTGDFDPGVSTLNLSSAGGVDIFLTSFNSAGNLIWADQFGGPSMDVGLSLVTFSSGVFFTGYFQGTADFDPSGPVFNLTSSGSNDAFICRINNNGNFNSAFKIGGSGGDVSNAIALDASLNVYITGQFNGVVDFDPSAAVSNLSSTGSSDVFVAKYSITGVYNWAKQMGGAFADYSYGLAVDNINNIYTTGSFKNISDFDPGVATFSVSSNANSDDVFIHKLNSDGTFGWVKCFGGAGNEISRAILILSGGEIYTTGSYTSTVDFNPDAGTFNITSSGNTDAYLHKLAPCVVPAPPVNTTSNANLNICSGQYASLTVSGSGLLTWYSTATSTTALATGPLYNTPTLTAGTYSYYIEASTCTLSASRTLITVVVTNCTSIYENKNTVTLVTVYPNPSSGIYTIEAPREMQVNVVNILGKKIGEQNVLEGKNQLDLSNYDKGVYFLQFKSTAKESVVIKLIKD